MVFLAVFFGTTHRLKLTVTVQYGVIGSCGVGGARSCIVTWRPITGHSWALVGWLIRLVVLVCMPAKLVCMQVLLCVVYSNGGASCQVDGRKSTLSRYCDRMGTAWALWVALLQFEFLGL